MIAGDIAVEFGFPEFGVVLWEWVIALRASMPEAAVDKDRELFADKADIGPSGPAFVMKAITSEARVPERSSQKHLRLRVLRAVRSHNPRDGFALWLGRPLIPNVVDGLIISSQPQIPQNILQQSDLGLWVLGFGFWVLVFRFWTR